MTSIFGIYSIAKSGLTVSQAALTATSDNIANIDTTGASKVAVSNSALETVQSGGTSTGSGVTVASILRSRDRYLESSYRSANADSAYLEVKEGDFEYMEKTLSEYTSTSTDSSSESTSSDGLEAAITTFFDDWSTVSTSLDSNSEDARTNVISAGENLISMLKDLDSELQDLQSDATSGVESGVTSLNSLASEVADLNGQISKAESGGGEASYLRDQRDELLDEMSSLADITVNESDGNLTVSLNGAYLVNGSKTNQLTVDGTGTETDPLEVKWANTGDTAIIKSGSIKAYLEEADQSGYATVDSSSLPYSFSTTSSSSSITTMRQALNDLVTTLATKVNDLCTSGVDQNGDSGAAFFTATDSSEPLSITNIEVNPKLCTSNGYEKLVTGTSGESGDNTIANKIYSLLSDSTCYKSDNSSCNIIGFYTALTTWVGEAGNTASSNYSTQSALTTSLNNQRQSVSGISTDEEMSNMIKYQEAYAASAKVTSTVDSMLETLVNELS